MAVPGGLGSGALRQAADGGGGHPEAFPRLDLEQMRVVDAAGERRTLARGEVLNRAGQVPREMYVVVRGALAGYANHGTPDERLVGVIGERQYWGGTNLFSGQPAYITTVAPEGAVVVVLSTDQARRVVSTNQRLGELVLAAMVARRALLVGMNVGLRVVGSGLSPDTRRVRELLTRNRSHMAASMSRATHTRRRFCAS